MKTALTNKIKLLTTILFSCLLIMAPVAYVFATPQDDLNNVQIQLAQIKKQKQDIQNQINGQKSQQSQYDNEINRLAGQINLLDTQIQENQLTIQELNLQIQILNDQSAQNEADIATAQQEIDKLQVETDQRMVDIYISEKTDSEINVFFTKNGTDIIKYSAYQSSYQTETNKLVSDLAAKKSELDIKKAQLEQDRLTVLADQTQLQEEETALEKNKTDLSQQQAVYYKDKSSVAAQINDGQASLNSLTKDEQQAQAKETQLEQQVFNNFKPLDNGTYVITGTQIGRQGCTGICTGPHLHFGVMINKSYQNPCTLLPSNFLPNCGGNGTLAAPMHGSYVLTSGYGNRGGGFHAGIDVANYNSTTPIYAAQNGWMHKGHESCTGSIPCNGGYANYIIICAIQSCATGLETLYWHLSAF